MKSLRSCMMPTLLALAVASTATFAQQSTSSTNPQVGSASQELTDGQILQVVRTLNDGEIKQAEEALDESDSDAVKQVARMILDDHETSNDQLDELLDGDLELDDSPTNTSLMMQAEQTHELLQNLSGSRYDCEYLQQQVAQHEMALTTAKMLLAPQATSPAVSAFLQEMGPRLEHHRMMAQQSLDNAGACG